MKNTLDEIQRIIEVRANDKVKIEMEELQAILAKSGLLDVEGFTVNSEIVEGEKQYKESLRSSLWYAKEGMSPIGVLYKKKLNKYIKEETAKFISDVDNLTKKADDLLSLRDDLENIQVNY